MKTIIRVYTVVSHLPSSPTHSSTIPLEFRLVFWQVFRIHQMGILSILSKDWRDTRGR